MYEHHQTLIVYPRRGRLARFVLLYAVVCLVIAPLLLATVGGVMDPGRLSLVSRIFAGAFALLCGAVCGLLGLLLLFTLYRIVVWKASITVTDEGIVDGCSLIVGGMGLVRWDQMAGLIPRRWGWGRWGQRDRHAYLVIVPWNEQEVLNRRGPIVRTYRRTISLILPGSLGLPEWLLSMSVEEVYRRILDGYESDLAAHRVYVPAWAANKPG